MKTKIIMLLVVCSLFAGKVNAQWVVSDPGNLAQGIINASKNIVQTSSTAQTMIKNFQETVKLYNQGKEYYDALKSVHNLVKDARKVQKSILLIGEISDIYVNSFQKMLSDENYTPDELSAIAYGYISASAVRFPGRHRPAGHCSRPYKRRFAAAMAQVRRPVPFRTRKLRPGTAMVLHPTGCGRVARRRTTRTGSPSEHTPQGAFPISETLTTQTHTPPQKHPGLLACPDTNRTPPAPTRQRGLPIPVGPRLICAAMHGSDRRF